jgi:phosphatidylserine/phosphatidylglycerophosphate/cardiolipin synthase-like enzyme
LKARILILGLIPCLAVAQTSPQADAPVASDSPSLPVSVPVTQIRAYFTPGHTVETAINDEINAAENTIRVQAYSFTNPLIVEALANARLRGVDVIVVLDKSNRTQRSSVAALAQRAGIPTLIDDRHAIAHNKIMIIDDRVVITGSYNFSRAAEKSNAENLVIIESAPIARKYQQNWQKHHQHSKPFVAGQRAP